MYYVNGSYVNDEEAKISVHDLGLVRGHGVFDYLRTYKGRPFHLWDHLERLQYSAKQIGLSLPFPLKKIEEIVETLLKKNSYAESSIKIIVTGGKSEDQFFPQNQPSLIVLVYPLKQLPDDCYVNGVAVTTTQHKRSMPLSKTLHYTPAILALQEGKPQNAKEALYINSNQEILEATTSNFFAFKGDALVTTHSDEVLLGITREVILKIAKGHFPIEVRSVSVKEIPSFEEAFVSASNKEILPVVQIDHHPVGKGVVGEKTKHLMRLFADYTQRSVWEPLKISRYL
jgi:branched-chain amino acid aminotransferase